MRSRQPQLLDVSHPPVLLAVLGSAPALLFEVGHVPSDQPVRRGRSPALTDSGPPVTRRASGDLGTLFEGGAIEPSPVQRAPSGVA